MPTTWDKMQYCKARATLKTLGPKLQLRESCHHPEYLRTHLISSQNFIAVAVNTSRPCIMCRYRPHLHLDRHRLGFHHLHAPVGAAQPRGWLLGREPGLQDPGDCQGKSPPKDTHRGEAIDNERSVRFCRSRRLHWSVRGESPTADGLSQCGSRRCVGMTRLQVEYLACSSLMPGVLAQRPEPASQVSDRRQAAATTGPPQRRASLISSMYWEMLSRYASLSLSLPQPSDASVMPQASYPWKNKGKKQTGKKKNPKNPGGGI